MVKSELAERIAAKKPRLYRRDAELIINTILDTISTALAQLSQLAGFEGQNAFVFKGGLRKVFTTERARESVGRTVRR